MAYIPPVAARHLLLPAPLWWPSVAERTRERKRALTPVMRRGVAALRHCRLVATLVMSLTKAAAASILVPFVNPAGAGASPRERAPTAGAQSGAASHGVLSMIRMMEESDERRVWNFTPGGPQRERETQAGNKHR